MDDRDRGPAVGVLQHWADLAIILVMLFINAGVGFWREFKADNAIALLKQRLALKARVRRDGAWKDIAAKLSVPGDAVLVKLGNIVPADVKLIEGAYAGSIAKQGEMNGLATAGGMNAYFGKTAHLVALGGGLMLDKFMLQGSKNIHPAQHYIQNHIDLYEHIDDPAYLAKEETFASSYENPIDLPGRWYLQAIRQLFMENRLAKGTFVGLGRTLSLRAITCPTYLLAGAADDITTPEQVLDAAKYIGTPKDRVVRKTVPGGHIGLFMGARTLKEHWPPIAQWIAAQ